MIKACRLKTTKQEPCQLFIIELPYHLGIKANSARVYSSRHTIGRTSKARPPQNSAFFCLRFSMNKPSILDEIQAKISQVMQQSPAKDLEKNLKTMLNAGFGKLDLLTREEFDIQMEVLARTRTRLAALEQRVAELEARNKS